MALTYRGQKGSALTIQELDDNFAYFTGSHAITGSLTVSGSLTTLNYVSGALLTPTGSFETPAPTFAASEGQFLFGSGSAGYALFAYLGGTWRSASLF